MNSTVEKLEGIRVRVTVTHDAPEVDAAISTAYKKVAGQIRLPGFRPGKAPRPMIDNAVGRERVMAEALEELVEGSWPRVLDEHGLRPIEQPDMGDLDLVEDGTAYTYTAEVDVRPELTLSSTADLKIAVPAGVAADEEIEAQLDYFRERFASLEPVTDRGLTDGDFALLSFTGTIDGEALEDLVVDKYLYEMGAGIMPPAFDEQITGMTEGETRTVTFVVPDNAANPDYIGKEASFEVVVHEVKAKKLPEADDKFALDFGGFDSIEALRDDIRQRLDGNKAAARVRIIEREARVALADRLVGEVPQRMIDSRNQAMTEEFFDDLRERGIDMERYTEATGIDVDTLRDDLVKEAAFRVRDELALEALYRAEGLSYTDEELDREIAMIADAEKDSVDKIRQRLVDTGVMGYVRERLVHRVATRWLMDNIVVEDEAPAGEEAAPAPKKKGTSKKAASKAAESTEE